MSERRLEHSVPVRIRPQRTSPQSGKAFVGVHASHWITTGLISAKELVGVPQHFPAPGENRLATAPAKEIVAWIAREILEVARDTRVRAVGVGIPGMIRHGIVETSPNLPQLDGLELGARVSDAIVDAAGIDLPVYVFNDADTAAAGIAANRGALNRLVRVWTLGTGIGFGRYPISDGVWEGGHMVVTLDPKENHCACGGVGHLEGIMGGRSIHLRFLDKEPEVVFSAAAAGDPSAKEFVVLWHRALAAASASCIHLDGPGEFFISGPNSRFLDIRLLTEYVDTMVVMSPLQGSTFTVVPEGERFGVVGAAINAEVALRNDGWIRERRHQSTTAESRRDTVPHKRKKGIGGTTGADSSWRAAEMHNIPAHKPEIGVDKSIQEHLTLHELSDKDSTRAEENATSEK